MQIINIYKIIATFLQMHVYIVQGKSNAVAPYVILGVVSLTGALAASFLPETFQHHLPETLEDADKFGKNSKFWSYLPKDSIKLEGSGSDEG